jgi:hypothetical protein
MTVSNQTNKTRQSGDGSTVTFNFSFPIFNNTDIEVYKIDTSTTPESSALQTITTDYTVTISDTSEGGSVTYVVAPTSDEDAFIKRVLPFTQTTNIEINSNFPEENVEDEFDKSRMLDIQVQEETDRTLKVNEFYSGSASFEIANPEASKVIGWDSLGTTLVNYSGSDLDTILTSSYGQQLVQSANALVARGLLELDTTDDVEFNDLTVSQITATTYVGLPQATTTVQGTALLDKYWIYGLIPSSNAVTPDEQVDVTAGKCVAQDGSTILSLDTPTTLDITTHITPGADQTLHAFLYRDTNGDDILDVSTSLTPTVGTGDANLPNLDGTKYRRIGSVLTDGSADIYKFYSLALSGSGTYIYYDAWILDYNSAPTTTETLTTMSIPSGLELPVEFSGSVQGITAGNKNVKFYNPNVTDSAVTNTNQSMMGGVAGDSSDYSGGHFVVVTDTSARVAHRASSTSGTLKMITVGYYDFRNNY